MCFLARCLQRLLRGTLLVSLAAGVLAPATAQTAAATDRPLLMQEVGSHSAPVRRIDVDVARGIAVTASDDRTARIWGLANGELRQVLRPFAFGAQAGRLYGVALHPKENLVAVAGTTGGEGQPHFIYLFDTESGQLQATIDARAGDVRKLAWSPDGTVLAAGYNGTNGVRFFARDGRELLDDRTDGPVFGLAIGANGLAAAVGLDGSLRAYRLSGGAVTRIAAITTAVRRPAGVAFSPDGRQIVVAYATANEGPELFDAATLASQGRLPVPRMFGGDFRVLAWSADGRRIAIGGTAYSRDLKFPVVTIDVASRAVAETADVAGDSVTDLLALPAAAGGGFAFASFDGSWGTVGTGAAVRTVGKPVFAVRGNAPQDLQISDDARSVQWGTVNPGGGFGFAFERRRLVTAPRESLRAPETRFGLFNAPTDWLQDARPPVIGGKAMQLAADERGRALVITRGQPNAAIVGTNRALYRVSERGDVVWRVGVDTEIRAVNASADGRIVVSAMADGTLRWWRASDGALLLTLLTQSDGRWVLFTPNGYFDASAGADRIAGWAVPRGAGQPMGFFSLNRFREQYNRPDVIDRILKTLDERQAFAELAAEQEAGRVALQRESERAAAAAREAQAQAERLAVQRAEAERQALARAAEQKTAAERAQREREAAERAAQAEAQRLAAEKARRDTELRAEAERAQREREAAQREAERVAAQAAREAAARAEAERQAEARRQAELAAALAAARAEAEREAARAAAREQARLAAEAAERERQRVAAEQARREAERQEALRVAAERERVAREAAAEAARVAARQEAERQEALRQAAERERLAREAAAAAALAAQREAERLEAARQQALREAAERDRVAKEAAREAEQRLALERSRKQLAEMKAAEFPPSLQGVSSTQIKVPPTATSVNLPFALNSPAAAGAVNIVVRKAGRPAQPAELVMPRDFGGKAQGYARVEVSFDAAGGAGGNTTTVELIAANRFGLSEPLVFIIERDAPARPPGTSPGDLYVLAIGVAEYQRPEYKLGLSAKDARDFAAAMQRQDGKQFRRVIVKTLTDAQATRAAVLRELEWLKNSVSATDTAMLFMAGHGVNDPTGQYFYIPWDGQHERLMTTAVPQEAIVGTLAQIKGRTLVFIDTCFAGNALGALYTAPKKTERLINDLSASENGVVVFASSTGHEESLERDSWGNGAFTKALLEGLSGRADFMRAGRITYAALNLYVSEEVTRLTEGKQRPVFISPRGVPDFAVARL
jgi:WD40 repeat protein